MSRKPAVPPLPGPAAEPHPQPRFPALTCTCWRQRSRLAAPHERPQQKDEPEQVSRAEEPRATAPPPTGAPAEPLALPHAVRSGTQDRRRTRGWRFSATPGSPRGSRRPPAPRHRLRHRSSHRAPPAPAIAAAIFRAT